MDKLTVRAFMTPSPLTIDAAQSLDAADELMRLHHIRHLPVLDQGHLIGIVSDRDLNLVRGLRDVDAMRVPVAHAMTPDPRSLSPDSSLEWVAAEMAQRKIGAMVVVEDQRVVGILTTIDALRALAEMLGRARRRRDKRAQQAS